MHTRLPCVIPSPRDPPHRSSLTRSWTLEMTCLRSVNGSIPLCVHEKEGIGKIQQFSTSSLATYGDPPPEDLARVGADSCEQLTDKQLGDGLSSQLRKGHHSVFQTRGDRADSPVQPGCHLQVEMARHLTLSVRCV